jgi:hypothetical protein
MERAERIVVLAFGLAFPSLMLPVLVVLLALSLITVGQRFVKIWLQASADRPVPIATLRRRQARTDARRRRRGRREGRVLARRRHTEGPGRSST